MAKKERSRDTRPCTGPEQHFSIRELPHADAETLQELLAEHRTATYRYAASIATDQDCAEDLTQRAILALIERRQDWNSREEIQAFLIHVVKKRVFKAARRREVRQRLQAPAAETLYSSPPSPEELIDSTRTMAVVREAMERLPPRRRQALLLARFEGLSYAEIGSAMKLAPQTVANHVSMALRDLRRILEESSPRIN
jgi:RNA polymerase sigma factor (sigma-70 family)